MVLISLTPSAVELRLATAPPLPPHLEMEGSPLLLALESITVFS